jgi:hypothetical protein
MNRRKFVLSVLAIPLSGFAFRGASIVHEASEAFRAIYGILQLRNWQQNYDSDYMNGLARKAGFDSITGNILIDVENSRTATFLDDKRVSYITQIRGISFFRNVDEAISGIYGVQLL